MAVRDRMAKWTLAYMTEWIVLPVVATCAATSWGLMLWLSLIPDTQVGAVWGMAILVTTTVGASILIKALRFPYSLHLAGIVLLIFLIGSDYAGGSGLKALILLLIWGASLLLGSVVAAAPPAHDAPTRDPSIAERLEELRFEWEVYALRRGEWMRSAGLIHSIGLLTTALAVWLITDWMGMRSAEAAEVPFGPVSAVLVCSLMLFVGLLDLLSRRRQWERVAPLHIDKASSRLGPRIVALTALASATIALLLPHDLSPLYTIDWNTLMNNLTVRLFGRTHHAMGRLDSHQPDWALPETPITSALPGGGLELIPLLYALAAILILGWGAWKALQLFWDAESGRTRGLVTMLKALLRLPLSIISILFQALFSRLMRKESRPDKQRPRNRSQRERAAATAALSVSTANVRRLFVLLLLWAKEQGSPRSAAQTVAEFAQSLTSRFPSVAEDIVYVASVYQNVRYSPSDTSPASYGRVRDCYKRIVASEARGRRARR